MIVKLKLETQETRKTSINPKVVVLIPPPVPPGEAPTNISIISKKRPVVLIVPMSTVLNAVVVEAEID